ncbi:ATP-dependent DNA helicase [Aeromonas phage B614]|nr:ATP-dependent DNA helicase [Aeromonas phage B614]UYD58127.1 ATP-dependent DNA helicase [Aeromonas phage UP87]UYD58491.1 ATP-dependent DNA helicase [Aeromonas phage avDM14-QBC]UYD58707.1 ATP-dependent DNA helicase [Aeromonas phage avDM10-HWA]UYD58990.1 ATP-dependent DNA helicase [Aeromonas phage avDM7-IJDJ]UYD59802.1 ATP-dependent DNA helicase [Aeromonas phage avDM9-HANS]
MLTYDDLTIGQKSAIERALEAMRTKRHITIRGPAGSGKTTMTRFLLERLFQTGQQGIVLTAPTHQAKKELSKHAMRKSYTIQSVLKINPSTLEENQIFEQKGTPDFSKTRVLICDEVSFYTRKLFDILMRNVPSHCVVIGIGDKAQIRGVSEDDTHELSPFFTDHRFDQIELTEVKRHQGPIIEVATDIRNGKWIYEKLDENGNGVKQYHTVKDFLTEYFRRTKKPDDLFDNRIMAYTNNSVDKLNAVIRKQLYGANAAPFIPGEILVMQEPLMFEIDVGGQTLKEVIFNNGQHVNILNVKPSRKVLKAKGVGEIEIECTMLECESHDEDEDDYKRAWFTVIHDQNTQAAISEFLSIIADKYRSREVFPNWKDFWAIRNAFTKVRPLGAMTFHKSQGSTFKNAYLFTPCLHQYCRDPDVAQELIYVGNTRARENVGFV